MNTKTIHLPNEISLAINTLTQKGFKAYLVGGAVRDFIVGNPVSDFDITTDATPEEIHLIFDKCIDTGISHGTVTVIINHTNIEITTFRKDGDYTDHRRPDSVSYSKYLEEDLSRRDFTVNALAYNPKSGIIDMFSGEEDIINKILKCVGDAQRRFEEDALRMLRLIRFSSKLGFDVEKSTLSALIKKEKLIEYVSKERIREEIVKTILSDYPEKLFIFKESKILDYIFGISFFKKINESIIINMKNLPKSHTVRLAYLLNELYTSNKEDIRNFLSELKFSNNEKRDIINMVSYVIEYLESPDIHNDRYSLKKSMAKYSKESVFNSFEILSLYNDINGIRDIFIDIDKNFEPYLINHLKISGKDLISIGYNGTDTGDCLKFLLEKVTENPDLNNEEILTKEAEKYYAEKVLRKN